MRLAYGLDRHVLTSLLINGVPEDVTWAFVARGKSRRSSVVYGGRSSRCAPPTLKQPLAQLRAVAILALHILKRCPFGGRHDKVALSYRAN